MKNNQNKIEKRGCGSEEAGGGTLLSLPVMALDGGHTKSHFSFENKSLRGEAVGCD